MVSIGYWIVPVIAGCVWLGGLLAMLCTWVAQGEPYYEFMHATSQHIVYISDIGATSWGKPVFIATSAAMVVAFDLVFVLERWLRHRRRLVQNYRASEKALSLLAILWSLVGGAALILLTVFDTKNHNKVHNAMLGLFIASYVICAVLVCAEYALLGLIQRRFDHEKAVQTHTQHRMLLTSFAIKLAFIVVEVAMAIAFGATEYLATDGYNTSAILEWIVALIFIFYVWSYVIDFLPVNYAQSHGRRMPEAATHRGSEEMNMTGGPAFT